MISAPLPANHASRRDHPLAWANDTPQEDFPPAWMPPVLVVDDDREFCDSTERYLTECGYAVECAHTATDGLDAAQSGVWRAIILNVRLPGIDGLEVLRSIRQATDVPVLVVSAWPDDADAIASLEAGADDHLAKGSSQRQLLARLHAITRRIGPRAAGADAGPEEIAVAELRIVPEARRAFLAGRGLALTPSQFNILLALAKARGRVKTRDGLSVEIRDRECGASDRALDVQVSCLRRKLGDDPKHPRFIRTVRALGYMLVNPDAS